LLLAGRGRATAEPDVTGSSARLPDDGAQTGVLLHHAGGLPDTSLLLDGTPAAAAAWDRDFQSALPVGTAVPVSDGDPAGFWAPPTSGQALRATPSPSSATDSTSGIGSSSRRGRRAGRHVAARRPHHAESGARRT
jgi:hypothetical protein